MAEAVARTFLGRGCRVASAGVQPRRRVDPLAAHVLAQRGYPTAGLRSKPLKAKVAGEADLVVVLAAEGEVLGPLPPALRIERWTVEDPLGWPRDVYEDVLSDIEEKVRRLPLELPSPRFEAAPSPCALALAPA